MKSTVKTVITAAVLVFTVIFAGPKLSRMLGAQAYSATPTPHNTYPTPTPHPTPKPGSANFSEVYTASELELMLRGMDFSAVKVNGIALEIKPQGKFDVNVTLKVSGENASSNMSEQVKRVINTLGVELPVNASGTLYLKNGRFAITPGPVKVSSVDSSLIEKLTGDEKLTEKCFEAIENQLNQQFIDTMGFSLHELSTGNGYIKLKGSTKP